MDKKRVFAILPFLPAALLAIIAVLIRYLVCRSLWLDEAALANNLMLEHTILNNTTYLQGAPPLFKLISLINVRLFGINEYALRLFPLICFVLSIPLFGFAINKTIKSKWAKIAAMFAFCLNPALIYWACEFKQYSCDCFISLLLINCVFYLDFKSLPIKKFFLFSLFYASCIWLSHFSLFFFLPFILYFILTLKGDKNFYKKILIFFLVFMFSFTLLYFLHLDSLVFNQALHTYWEQSFINVTLNLNLLLKDFIGSSFPYVFYLLLIVLVFAGIFGFFLKNKAKAVFLTVFFLSPVTASLLALYPFNIRLYLSFIPLILIFAFSAADIEIKILKLCAQIFLIAGFSLYFLCAVFNIFNKNGYYREEMRPLLFYLSANIQKGDKIYLKKGAHQAFRFYNNYYKIHGNRVFNFDRNDVIFEQYCKNNNDYCNLSDGRVWVIYQSDKKPPNNAKVLNSRSFGGNSIDSVIVE